ncbi:MAG: hypothetical protein ACOX6Q_02185 [Candidatus Dojkabacteria bacterium]|jgi:hypothetical protein
MKRSSKSTITTLLILLLLSSVRTLTFALPPGWGDAGAYGPGDNEGYRIAENEDGGQCRYLPGGAEEPECDPGEPPCIPHACTPPPCPTNTTKYDTGYFTNHVVSCDKGCGESERNNCYEIPTTCNPEYENCEDPYLYSLQSEVVFQPLQTTNKMGYTSTTYSGLELNNPVGVEAKYWSTVDNNKLEAIYFWMAKEETAAPGLTGGTNTEICIEFGVRRLPSGEWELICTKTKSVPPTKAPGIEWIYNQSTTAGKTISNGSWGFMVRKVNGSWSEVYVPLVTNTKTYWAKIGNVGATFTIHSPSGKPLVNISDLKISQTNKVISNFRITFLNEQSGVSNYEKVSEGIYYAYTMVNDEFGFTPWDNYTSEEIRNKLGYKPNQIRLTDQWKKGPSWGVDLTRPTVSRLQTIIPSSTRLALDWEGQDSESEISYAVGNVFRLRDALVKNSPIIYPSGSGRTFTLNFQSDSDVLGKINGSNVLWQVANVKSRLEDMDLVDNRGGYMDFYVTVFDKGGNHITQNLRFKLGEWIQTKGGFFYSKKGAYLDTRRINPGVWTERQLFDKYGFKENEVDLGTELIAGDVQRQSTLAIVNYLNQSGVFRGINYVGYRKSDVYYEYMDKLQDVKKEKYEKITVANLSGNLTDHCFDKDKCKNSIVVNVVDGNLTLNSGFQCDTKSVMLINGNIYVNPDITNMDNRSACVFIAKDNVFIKEGIHKSGSSIGFDQVEGYFLANGTIKIEKENKPASDRTDGLIIEGGIVSFGTDPAENASIMLKRELHLADRHPYPVLNIVHHAKYGKLMQNLFGGDRLVFKTEIGFKQF